MHLRIIPIFKGAEFYGQEFNYLGFTSQDDETYPIMDHFEDVFTFIEDARVADGKCLIHCMAGVNRSGALAVAYVMVHRDISPVAATKLVLKARGMILSNGSFVEQLISLASQRGLLGKLSGENEGCEVL